MLSLISNILHHPTRLTKYGILKWIRPDIRIDLPNKFHQATAPGCFLKFRRQRFTVSMDYALEDCAGQFMRLGRARSLHAASAVCASSQNYDSKLKHWKRQNIVRHKCRDLK